MTDEKGVGGLPDAGTIQPGDPGHIETHDEMARLMQVAADSLGIILDPPAPKPAVIGEYGHVDAHNTLLANIEQLAAAGGGGLPGELPGLGGWADITEVTGSPKRYAYNDSSTDWVAFEWTQDGSLTTQDGGLVDAIIVGGGGVGESGGAIAGNGGGVIDGVRLLGISSEVLVGAGSGSESNIQGEASALGSTQINGGRRSNYGPNGYGHPSGTGYAGGIGATGVNTGNTGGPGVVSSIRDGNPREYGRGGDVGNGPPPSNVGQGGHTQGAGGHLGSNGVVICRVPAAQAEKVDPGSWVTRINYYAEVTDGIVTDLYQERFYGDDTVRTENGRYASPEQPDDLIPCDPMVAEGWSYDGKEFAPPPPPPPPTREEIIAELQARMDELTKDKK